jgi:hypothetical protein
MALFTYIMEVKPPKLVLLYRLYDVTDYKTIKSVKLYKMALFTCIMEAKPPKLVRLYRLNYFINFTDLIT